MIFLQQHLNEMQSQNPNYSLRAFAQKLEETPGYLSKVLTRRVKVSSNKIYKYSKALDLSREQICDFLLFHLEKEYQTSVVKE